MKNQNIHFFWVGMKALARRFFFSFLQLAFIAIYFGSFVLAIMGLIAAFFSDSDVGGSSEFMQWATNISMLGWAILLVVIWVQKTIKFGRKHSADAKNQQEVEG